MRNALAVLSEISERLPEHIPGVAQTVIPADVLLAGSATKCLMMSEPEISVYKWVMAAGTELATHSHPGHELMIITHGCMELSLDDDLGSRFEKDADGKYVIAVGSMVTVTAGSRHGAVFPVESTILTVHIPRSEEYESWPTETSQATLGNTGDCSSVRSKGSVES